MDKTTKYPIFLKSPERGLYFKINSPFEYSSLRYLNTVNGYHIAAMNSETSQVETTWLLDTGLKESSAQEFASIAKRIKKHINETFITL